jgi:MerR family transcriptional regulator, light-induced transcriptional regulator
LGVARNEGVMGGQLYRIEEVVRLTGVSKQALHAWERRHGALCSARTPSNRRLFSEDDLVRLLLLKRCTELGHRISRIFDLDAEALQELIREPKQGQTAEILDRIGALDKDAVNRILVERLLLLGPSSFAVNFVMPLMKTLGELWHAGHLTVAAEHLASAAVRSLLGGALKPGRIRDDAKSVLFCTPEGEIHELGTLVAAVLAQEAGKRAHYFGAQLPVSEVGDAARKLDAQAVCVGSTFLTGPELSNWVTDLDAQLAGHVQIWAGGAGFVAVGDQLPSRVRLFSGITEFELFLKL